MNHILQLQEDKRKLQAKLDEAHTQINAFRAHLHSSKFQGTEGGERKDWISTADVLHRLRDMEGAMSQAGE